MSLKATVLRKPRAVGIVPIVAGAKFEREQLEEAVLAVQKHWSLVKLDGGYRSVRSMVVTMYSLI